MKLNFTLSFTIFCMLAFLSTIGQTTPIDINGDGTLNILVLGTTKSIEDNYDAFSPNQITTELQSILSSDTLISSPVNVVSEDIYRSKNVFTGIAGSFTANLDYYCHSLTQYYYWPDDRSARINNLKGDNGIDWDYVVISADPYIISKMPGYYSLGVNKIAKIIHDGGAVPLLLMEWTTDSILIDHFKEFTYRTADNAKIPIQVIAAGLAWQSLPNNLKDTSSVHPTPNGAFVTAASIYSHLFRRSASISNYIYNDSIADAVDLSRIITSNHLSYIGHPDFISPYKSCEVSDSNLIYNHGGTSTENGFLIGLEWVVNANNKTIAYGSTAPIHFNYGRSSMGSTHLYRIDSTLFDYSFGYPLQDDARTGLETMLYGLDKRNSSIDVETDLGTARQMINQSELPYARNVPLRTIIAQLLEEIPGILIYPFGDPWHLHRDVNIAIGSYMYTILTGDCTIPPSPTICSDSTQWRTWMAHKIGQETAWNLMYLQGTNSCNKSIDTVEACSEYTWVNGITYTSSNSSATHTYSNMAGCDSTVILNLSITSLNTSVTQTGTTLLANMGGANYQWINCSTGTPISGANNQSFVASTSGDYAVILTNNGCSDTSSCYNINMVGIVENNFENKLLVYPNPTDKNITIDLGSLFENVNVTVRNCLGIEVINKNYKATSSIDLAAIGESGIYFLTVSIGNKKTTLKLVKK